MELSSAFLGEVFYPAIIGSGALFYIIKSIIDRKRNKADTAKVDTESAQINVDNAIRISSHAVERNVQLSEEVETMKCKLQEAEDLVIEVKAQLEEMEKRMIAEKEHSDKLATHIQLLEHIMRSNGIEPIAIPADKR